MPQFDILLFYEMRSSDAAVEALLTDMNGHGYRRGGSWRGWFRRATALTLLALFAAAASGQDEEPAEASFQLWANIILAKPNIPRLYFELEIDPKYQISGGETWRNVDATPLVEFYVHKLVDLTGEVTVGYTRQNESEDSLEVTPRFGVRLHFVDHLWDQFASERLPLSRLYFANLARIEFRNLRYTGDRPSSHEARLRNRLEFRLALNHPSLSVDRTWYLFSDLEFFVPLGEEVPERFATKSRFRGGLGYRLSRRRRFELLYIRDFARETLEEPRDIDMNAIDFRLKILL